LNEIEDGLPYQVVTDSCTMSIEPGIPFESLAPSSRRSFLRQCALLASLLALPPGSAALFAEVLRAPPRRPLIWLSFQVCTGCTESLSRSYAPTLEQLIFEVYSLDYHHTLQAASGEAAEAARDSVLAAHAGDVLLVVDGSVPIALDGACCTIAGEDSLSLLRRGIEAAESVLAVGSCASFDGLAGAAPNPTGALGVMDLMTCGLVPKRPLVNLPGCPPIPEAIAAVLMHRVAFGRLPDLDDMLRPRAFYGETVHERCSRRGHYEAGRFARTFDDAGARAGWCLLELGCKGPVTHNACATLRWNSVGNPMESGHPCLGCAQPGFWDRGGFYRPLEKAKVTSDDPLDDGAAVYDSHCVYCHDADPAKLKTAPDRITELLDSGTVRAHRFKLEADETRALIEYLKETRP
jgi:hydrogenase small subunit